MDTESHRAIWTYWARITRVCSEYRAVTIEAIHGSSARERGILFFRALKRSVLQRLDDPALRALNL